ncbi:uncharacterized protein LOC115830644 [Nomascus leucogenys]|uniref:uncharacterized protein LOC115830644 n=1 Tax=Nomascus leucogenys TaxID=61853 RepID=UPI00122DA1AA|nr:uncharacterized protein LOC115830644 [Nomascus leucogenys]
MGILLQADAWQDSASSGPQRGSQRRSPNPRQRDRARGKVRAKPDWLPQELFLAVRGSPRPRRGSLRLAAPRGSSRSPPPLPALGCWALGRGLGARGSPGGIAGSAAGAQESRLASAPCAWRLSEPLSQFESGWPLGCSSGDDGQSRRAELAPAGALRADLGRRKDRSAREGTGRGGWVWGAGARPGTAAEGKWGCRRGIEWEQRESTVLGAQSGGQACLDQSGRRMGGKWGAWKADLDESKGRRWKGQCAPEGRVDSDNLGNQYKVRGHIMMESAWNLSPVKVREATCWELAGEKDGCRKWPGGPTGKSLRDLGEEKGSCAVSGGGTGLLVGPERFRRGLEASPCFPLE